MMKTQIIDDHDEIDESEDNEDRDMVKVCNYSLTQLGLIKHT